MPDKSTLLLLGAYVSDTPDSTATIEFVKYDNYRGYARAISKYGDVHKMMHLLTGGGLTGTWIGDSSISQLTGLLITNIGPNKIIKSHKTVTIYAIFGATLVTAQSLAVIPEGFRPVIDMYRVPVALRNSGSGALGLGFLNITANGYISLDPGTPITGFNEIDIFLTYVSG